LNSRAVLYTFLATNGIESSVRIFSYDPMYHIQCLFFFEENFLQQTDGYEV